MEFYNAEKVVEELEVLDFKGTLTQKWNWGGSMKSELSEGLGGGL